MEFLSAESLAKFINKSSLFICYSIENFQSEPMPNSEQKVDEMHVSPAIAKPPLLYAG